MRQLAACPPTTPEYGDFYYVQAQQSFGLLNQAQGIVGEFSQHSPQVPSAPNNHSLAQFAINGALGPLTSIEMGWVVDPTVYHDSDPHLFVFTRSLACNSCAVTQLSDETWTCDFHSFANAPFHPNSKVKVTDTPQYFAAHSQGKWYIGYKGSLIGYIPDSRWGLLGFQSVTKALWFGEVLTPSGQQPLAQMGNGVCGSQPGSAVITGMRTITKFTPIGDPSNPSSYNYISQQANAHLSTVTKSLFYNSNRPISTRGKGFDNFSYGGPGAGVSPGCL